MTAAIPESGIDQVRAALGTEYDVLRLLGQGGMAAVYLARERALKRLVAIKVLDPELGASPVFRARFQREAATSHRSSSSLPSMASRSNTPASVCSSSTAGG